MAISPEQKVIRIAARQRLLVTRKQAVDAGLTARQIRNRLRSGRWTKVRPNVFSVDGRRPSSWEAVVLAVVLAVPGAVASHRTALWLHGVRRLGKPDTIEVSAPLGTRVVLPGVRVRQHRSLPGEDRGMVGGVPVTTCERTVIDLAAELELGERLGVLEEALTSGPANRRTFLRRALATTNGRAGVRVLIDATSDDAGARFRSWLEAEAARIWEEAGLPAPRWNVVLRDGRGRIGEIDAVFPDGVVTVELDGLRFHSTPGQRRRDRARDRRLALAGCIPLRFDWEDVVLRPQAMVAELREALTRASHAGAPAAAAGDRTVSARGARTC